MYCLYQFFPTYSPYKDVTQTNIWVQVQICTLLEDAEAQQTRLIASGIDSNYLRQLTDADPVPNDIPSP